MDSNFDELLRRVADLESKTAAQDDLIQALTAQIVTDNHRIYEHMSGLARSTNSSSADSIQAEVVKLRLQQADPQGAA